VPTFDIPGFLLWYFAFLFSITLHEAAHAWAAYRGGDPTAYLGGQVSLNPLPHIRREPLGTVLVPIFTFFRDGWMMGWASAPYNPLWARRHPRQAGLMAAAGPASNLLIVVAVFAALKALLLMGLVEAPNTFGFSRIVEPAGEGAPVWAFGACRLASILLNLNLVFFCFNLLPVPPLDGYGIVAGLAGGRLGNVFRFLEGNPALSLLGLLLAWLVFPRLFFPVSIFVLRLLYAGGG
jgi:Zn-dependent protease